MINVIYVIFNTHSGAYMTSGVKCAWPTRKGVDMPNCLVVPIPAPKASSVTPPPVAESDVPF